MTQGALAWRQGDWDAAAEACSRAHDLGEQVGRSEIAYTALFWRAAALRDGGDCGAAETELARALDLCERAGLIPQSLEATSARAVALAITGRGEAARAAADEAERLISRLTFPVGEAATAEARGAAAEGPAEGAAALAEAATRWAGLGRPLDEVRALSLQARRLAEAESDGAEEARRGCEERLARLGLGAHRAGGPAAGPRAGARN